MKNGQIAKTLSLLSYKQYSIMLIQTFKYMHEKD